MLAGVTIVDPAATVVDVGVTIAQDTVIAPFTSLHGVTSDRPAIAPLGPTATLLDATRGGQAQRSCTPTSRRP